MTSVIKQASLGSPYSEFYRTNCNSSSPGLAVLLLSPVGLVSSVGEFGLLLVSISPPISESGLLLVSLVSYW